MTDESRLPEAQRVPLTISTGSYQSLGPLSVEVIPERGESLQEFSLSSGHREEQVRVPAGRYAVIARRPNGQRLFRSVTVKAGRPASVSLAENLPESPNEFMEPERHRGEVALDATAVGQEVRRGILLGQFTPTFESLRAPEGVQVQKTVGRWTLRAWYKDSVGPARYHLQAGTSFLKVTMDYEPRCLALGLLSEAGTGPIVMIPPFKEILHVTFPAECLLPLAARYAGATAQRSLVALVTPSDPRIADLLTALSSVTVEQTGAIWEQNSEAIRYVYEKYYDPVRALVGAHYLLRFLPDRLPIEWADNLCRVLPDAADGPVIAAWLRLTSHSDEVLKLDPEQVNDGVKDLFSKALTRRITYFARTRRLLVDGAAFARISQRAADSNKPSPFDYLDYGAHAGGLEAFWGSHPFSPGLRRVANEPPYSDLAILGVADKLFASAERAKRINAHLRRGRGGVVEVSLRGPLVDNASTRRPAAQVSRRVAVRDRIFISYHHKDAKWHQELMKVLSSVQASVDIWDDTMIQPGARWTEEIEKALASAKAAVLLVSPDFLMSDFIEKNELPPLLEAARKGGCWIFWIEVKESLVLETPIGQYQALYDKPLISLKTQAERNKALYKIAKSIAQVINTAEN